MVNAKRDDNRITTLLATLNSDGITPQLVYINPSNHGVAIDDDTIGSGTATTNSKRDDNRVTTLWGVSSADGVTPVAIWADSNGKLLINSN